MNSNLLLTIIIAAFSAMSLSVSYAQTAEKTESLAAANSDPSYAIIVLDASGSMWGQVNGEAKIEIARRVIRKLVTKLPENIHLGLVAYGHRKKGDCSDIQLLIEPGKIDRKRFIDVVDNITPKGMTPLTSAIEFAAENLAFKEQKASVILVSDGKETCDRDPCSAAQKLEKLGVDFTAHVVAFDLSEKDAKSIECIAKETGGSFLTANDAGTLADALQMAIDEVTEETKSEEKPEIKLDPATVKGPAKVPAGSEFQIEWTGPNNKGDYITIVPKDWEDGRYKHYVYTRNGSPLKLTAFMKVGPAELRYMTIEGRKVLGRADIEITPVQATVKADAECVAGAEVSIEWTGPNNKGDFITVVPKSLEDGKYKRYAYSSKGSPVKVLVPIEPGDCEIRYMSGRAGDRGRAVLGRADLKVTKAAVTLKAPEKCTVGNVVPVEWTGPNNKADFITIVPKNADEKKYLRYEYTKQGSPLKVEAPTLAGACEIRYLAGQDRKLLARIPLEVEAAKVILKADSEVVAGSPVSIEWIGPNNRADSLVIVPKNAADSEFANYAYTKPGSPAKAVAPMEPGDYEIRYMSGRDRVVYGRIDIKVVKAELTLKAPAKCTVGNAVQIEWVGPNNKGDMITIVPKNAEGKTHQGYQYTAKGSPTKVEAPILAGACEIRYLSGKGRKVLARIPIEVEEATITLEAAGEVDAGSPVIVEWTGPNNKRDFITIVPKNAADGKYARETYTKEGSPMKVVCPIDPGDCEIRYMSGQKRIVLGRMDLKVVKATISMKAQAQATAGSEVVIQWTGPSNPKDYITIVPKSQPEGKSEKYAYTSKGSPLRVKVPAKAGECEIRFVAGQGGGTLHRIPIKITPAAGE